MHKNKSMSGMLFQQLQSHNITEPNLITPKNVRIRKNLTQHPSLKIIYGSHKFGMKKIQMGGSYQQVHETRYFSFLLNVEFTSIILQVGKRSYSLQTKFLLYRAKINFQLKVYPNFIKFICDDTCDTTEQLLGKETNVLAAHSGFCNVCRHLPNIRPIFIFWTQNVFKYKDECLIT